jgi:hypothetical protein
MDATGAPKDSKAPALLKKIRWCALSEETQYQSAELDLIFSSGAECCASDPTEVAWPHLLSIETAPRSTAAVASQVCQWERTPAEMKNSPVQCRSAAIRQNDIVNASKAAGVNRDAKANASA